MEEGLARIDQIFIRYQVELTPLLAVLPEIIVYLVRYKDGSSKLPVVQNTYFFSPSNSRNDSNVGGAFISRVRKSCDQLRQLNTNTDGPENSTNMQN